MPISSKVIMEHLAGLDRPVTESQVIHHFAENKKSKRDVKPKRGKKKTGNLQPDIKIIHETFHALMHAGLIEKKGKGYLARDRFMTDEKIDINSTGHGIVRSEKFGDILITDKDRGKARHNDTVTVLVYEYRRGFFHGKVIGLARGGSGKLTLEIVRSDDNFYYLKSVDFSSELMYRADKTGSPVFPPGTLAIAEPGAESIQGNVLVTVTRFFAREDESADFERICARHDLPGRHKEPVGLPDLAAIINDPVEGKRKDFREIFTVTIDGEHAKDFDDAISAEKNADGVTLYVHIADVSAYIHPGSVMDTEARFRGTSYYIGNQVIPMFHELISNDLCSLRQDQDRPAMTAVMKFDSKGNEVGAYFTRSLIRVNRRLTYQGAAQILAGSPRDDSAPLLQLLLGLTKKLKKIRLDQGRLDLDLPDTELIFNGDSVSDIVIAERLDSHMIVEECMLSANIAVSRTLKEAGIPTLYRIHEPVTDEAMNAMGQFLKIFSIKIKKSKDPAFYLQSILKAVAGRDNADVVNYIILRSLTQAYYGIEPLGHFGLGFSDYTHFTSPIRRYPDLVVHRCLKSLIDKAPHPYGTGDLIAMGERSSETERLAMKAERDMVKLKSCRIMKNRVGEVFTAVVSGIGKNGFYVTLREKPVEGMVPLRYLTNDYYLVKEDEYTIVGRRFGVRFRLGDIIKVRLADVDPALLRLDFTVP